MYYSFSDSMVNNKIMYIIIPILILLILGGVVFYFLDNKGIYRYEDKIIYEKGWPLQFEDFQITYIGEVPPPAPIDVGVGYEFEVVNKKGQKQRVTVLHSGNVMPVAFSISDTEHFVLNLVPVEYISSRAFYMVISKD